MFVNIQIDLIILKTDDEQFTLTTKKKSLRITFKTTGKSQTHNSDNTCPSKWPFIERLPVLSDQF